MPECTEEQLSPTEQRMEKATKNRAVDNMEKKIRSMVKFIKQQPEFQNNA